MEDKLSLAMKVRDICLKNKVEWKIKINGSVEIEATKDIPKGNDFYYMLKGKVNSEDDLGKIEYNLKHKRAPD
jgi:hypothetical protein